MARTEWRRRCCPRRALIGLAGFRPCSTSGPGMAPTQSGPSIPVASAGECRRRGRWGRTSPPVGSCRMQRRPLGSMVLRTRTIFRWVSFGRVAGAHGVVSSRQGRHGGPRSARFQGLSRPCRGSYHNSTPNYRPYLAQYCASLTRLAMWAQRTVRADPAGVQESRRWVK